MSTYKTGNQVGSPAVKDLFDNAENLDMAVNDLVSPIWVDRLGRTRKSIAGYGYDVDRVISKSQLALLEFQRDGYAAIDRITSFTWRGSWSPATAYQAKDVVTVMSAGALVEFITMQDHTSSQNFELDRAAGFWTIYQGIARAELAASGGSQLIGFQQLGAGAIGRTNQQKLRETVSVEDFRQIGDADDTESFLRALAKGCVVIAAGDAYTLRGEWPVLTGTHLQFTRNPLLTVDLSGENGRGFYFPPGTTNNSVTGSFRADVTITSVGSDGSRNGLFTLGSDYYVTADPLRTHGGTIAGDFDVRMLGPMNGKVVQIYGYVEDVLVRGIRGRGQTNFAFVAHWAGNGGPNIIPTKTWHPHRLAFRDCIAENDSTGNLLRGFTFSACGHTVLDNLHSLYAATLGFNLFVGDFAYTFAQNLGPSECFDFAINDSSAVGPAPSISVDGISSRLYGSPLWAGPDSNASLKISGFLARRTAGPSSIGVAVAGLASFNALGLRIIEEDNANTSAPLYLTSVGAGRVAGEIVSRLGALARDCGNIDYELNGKTITDLHDVASYRLAASAISDTVITTADVPVGSMSVPIAGATIVTGPGGFLRFNDGTRDRDLPLLNMSYSGSAQTLKIPPALVAIPAGTSLALIQTVRQLNIGAIRLSGSRFLLSLTGTALAKPRNVTVMGATFRRGGASDINAAAVDGLTVIGSSFNESGQTTTGVNNQCVSLGPNAESYVLVSNRFGKGNDRVRYLINCDNASKNGVINSNVFESINAGVTSPAAIFKQSAANVLIGPNLTLNGITPVFPIP